MASPFELRFSPKSKNQIARLDRPTKQRILSRLDELCANPFDARLSVELTSRPGVRRSRVGLWRVVYEVYETTRVVYVLVVQPRGQVYKRI